MNSTMWKIALRTLARDKAYAVINVAGLAIAVTCCLILAWVSIVCPFQFLTKSLGIVPGPARDGQCVGAGDSGSASLATRKPRARNASRIRAPWFPAVQSST